MKVIEQKYRVEIDGILVTDRVTTARASKTLNRLYDVLTLMVSYKVDKNATVTVTIGDYVFNGFVYSSSRVGYGEFTVECRSMNALLASPFYQGNEVTYDEAQTSSELFDLYAAMAGISIVSSEVDLDFGVSYKREGTPQQEIEKVCGVTKADFYDNGTGISIEPKKDTSELGRVLSMYEYEDFLQTKTDIENSGIRWVIVNESSSVPKGANDPDVDNGSIQYTIGINNEIVITANEYGTLNATRMLSPNFTSWNYFPKVDELMSINDTSISMSSSIKRIDRLTVNGISIGYSHKPGSSLITFTSSQRGVLSIKYVANAFKTKLMTSPIAGSSSRSWKFDALVGKEWQEYQGIIRPGNGDGIRDPETGEDLYYSMTGQNYEKGFKIFASNDLGVSFTLDGVALSLSNTKTNKNITMTESRYVQDGGLVEVPNGTTIVGIKYNGVEIAYSPDPLGVRVGSGVSGSVDVTFTTAGVEYSVKDHKYDGQVMMQFKDGTETYLYPSNPDNPNDVAAGYPARVPIDVASEMNLPVSAVTGKTLIVTNSNGVTVWSGEVDKYGFIYPTVTEDGVYKINIDSIVPNSKMKLTAGCK